MKTLEIFDLSDLSTNYKNKDLYERRNDILIYGNSEDSSLSQFKAKVNRIKPSTFLYCSRDHFQQRYNQLNSTLLNAYPENNQLNIISEFNLYPSDEASEVLKRLIELVSNQVDTLLLQEVKMAYYEVLENIFSHNQESIHKLKKDDKVADIALYTSKDYLFLLTTDYFGNLTLPQLEKSLFSDVKINQMSEATGAGIGFNLLYFNSALLGVNVFPSRKTSILIGHTLNEKSENNRHHMGKLFYLNFYN